MREVARSAGGSDIEQHFFPPVSFADSPLVRGGLGGHHRYTYVLVNDPTTGYGIFIENMLDVAA